MKERELLKQARDWIDGNGRYDKAKQLVKDIDEALANHIPDAENMVAHPAVASEQKPWGACVSGRVFVGNLPEHVRKLAEDEGLTIQQLYTNPPASKLWDWEPIQEFWRNNSGIDWNELEAAIKESLMSLQDGAQPSVSVEQDKVWVEGYGENASGYVKAQLKQDPVAVVATTNEHHAIISWMCAPKPHGSYLYTNPRQRTWVDLTEDEIQTLLSENRFAVFALIRAVEAKLKEKNT